MVTVGLSYLNARPEYTNDAGQVTGAGSTSAVVPNVSGAWKLMDGRLAVGLAAVMPYGLESHWNGDSPLRYAATDARLRIVDVIPAVAYKVSDSLSAGAGLDYYNTILGSLEHKIDVAGLNANLTYKATGNAGAAVAAGTGPDANSRLNGKGDGWGYHLGLTYRPNEHHQIGVVYHSSVKIGLSGNVQLVGLSGTAKTVFGGNDFQTDVTAPLYLPQNIQIGYAFMPNESWLLEADAAWYDFYSMRQLGKVYPNVTPGSTIDAVLQNNNPQQFDGRKTINFGLGAEYKQNDALRWRGGFYYQASSLPERTFDPSFLDLPRYGLTAGTGWKFAKDFTLDGAYNAIFTHTRHITVAGPANPFGVANNKGYSGSFNSFVHVLSAAVTYRL
ncbi:MAG: outer membrane protein transport protein [Elusimicrobia bacterium]|nr:outer membrane protein transport protein [Elusimicrobiota bacterium]